KRWSGVQSTSKSYCSARCAFSYQSRFDWANRVSPKRNTVTATETPIGTHGPDCGSKDENGPPTWSDQVPSGVYDHGFPIEGDSLRTPVVRSAESGLLSCP